MTDICEICDEKKDNILIRKYVVDKEKIKNLKICEDCDKEIFKFLAKVKETTICN